MKKFSFLLPFFFPLFLLGQDHSKDSLAIIKACNDYVGGFYYGDTNKIKLGVHPELVKRIIDKSRDFKISSMSRNELVMAAAGRSGKPKQEDFKLDVMVFDIDHDIALAKITTNKLSFFDYVQLAKINKEWKVINVLWAINK